MWRNDDDGSGNAARPPWEDARAKELTRGDRGTAGARQGATEPPETPPSPEPSPARARGFVLAAETGAPLQGIGVAVRHREDDGERTLGILSSDAAGYVSFDLTDAPADVTPDAVWLEVVGHPEARASVIEGERGGSTSAAVAVLQVAANVARGSRAGASLPSVQGTPDDVDRRISPYSFVSPRKLRVGDGDCAVPVRSELPIRTVGFVQIVRRPLVEDGGEMKTNGTTESQTSLSDVALDPFVDLADVTPKILACDILDYEQSWCDLGESLGTLLHSIPLAPCESVNIAVIEASRADEASRDDAVRSEEELAHSVVRDRNIDESVKAALKESQGGSSFMAGHSGAYSGKFPIGNFGATHSLGYASTNSWGKRDLKGHAVQELHDATVQGTDLVRSLNSTVIVQGTQAERHALETRTVTNHNHCHALTVQYYEVLRRMKLVTRFQRSRPGVLVPYHGISFKTPRPVIQTQNEGTEYQVVRDPDREDLNLVNRLRPYLDAVLLQPELTANFDAIRRLLFFPETEPPAGVKPKPSPSSLTRFTARLKRGPFGTASRNQTNLPSTVLLKIRLKGGRFATRTAYPFINQEEDRFWFIDAALEGDKSELTWLADQAFDFHRPIPLDDVLGVQVHWVSTYQGHGRADWSLRGIQLRGVTADGQEILLVDRQTEEIKNEDVDEEAFKDFESTSGMREFAVVPPASEAPVPETSTPDPLARAQLIGLAWELITHIHEHRDHYSEVLIANKDTSWFAHALDRACGTLLPLRERIDSVPVAVSGGHIVFPLHAPGTAPVPAPAAENAGSLVRTTYTSLPTRGLFAEAQLGTCNSCEKRDSTRFWKWEESPCERAAAIEGITPGFRGQAPNVEAADLPNAVVQITQPPAAPDPVGLAAALTLLGKSDLFRDMSGSAELQQLLAGLTSGAISLAGAQQLATKVQEKGTAGTGGTGGGGTTSKQSPAERYDNLQVAKEVADAARALGWTPQTTEAITSRILGGQTAAEQVGSGGTYSTSSLPVSRDPGSEAAWAREHPEGYVEMGIVNGKGRPDILVMWNFGVGSADVSRFGAQLTRHTAMLKGWTDLGDQIFVQGGTSPSGSEDSNLTLGLARALAVKRWLTTVAGLPAAQLNTTTLGETDQVQGELSTIDGETAARNRRVVLSRIALNWADEDEDNYDRALKLVATAQLPVQQKKRLTGLLTHLRSPYADDLYFNTNAVLWLRQFVGHPGWEWLEHPASWAFGEPPLLTHMRERFAMLHPRSSDSVVLGELKSVDLLLLEGIDWINDIATRTDVAEGKLDVFYEAIKNWIAARQKDPTSLYYSYGAGQ